MDFVPLSTLSTEESNNEIIRRPSVLLRELNNFIHSVIKTAETGTALLILVNVDIVTYCQNLLMEVFGVEDAKKLSEIKGIAEPIQNGKILISSAKKERISFRKKGEEGAYENAPNYFCNFYSEVVLSNANNGSICYSPLYKAFVGRNPLDLILAEDYLNFQELKALSCLMGPSAILFFAEKLEKQIVSLVGNIKDNMNQNIDLLQSFKITLENDNGKFYEIVKKYKGFDEFILKAVKLGVILEFQKLLLQSYQFAVSEKIPLAYETVAHIHKQYTANIFAIPDLLSIDLLANSMGIVDRVDVSLRKAVDFHCRNENKIWSFLPLVFGLSVYHCYWMNLFPYQFHMEASENNFILLATSFAFLCETSTSLIFKNDVNAITATSSSMLSTATKMLFKASAEKENVQKDMSSSVMVLKRVKFN